MDDSLEIKGIKDNSAGQCRRDKGKKRTQIVMAGYKGQKEEFLNAFNQSINKEVGNESLLNSSNNMIQEILLLQNEGVSMFNEGTYDQDGGGGGGQLFQDLLNKDPSLNEKLGDQSGSIFINNSELMPFSNCNKSLSKIQINKQSQQILQQIPCLPPKVNKKQNPYQGQDILNEIYYNYSKIYEGKQLQGKEGSTNLPLIMKLKEITLKFANSIQTRRQQHLTSHSYSLINDKSYFHNKKDKQQIIMKINFLRQTKKSIQQQYFITKKKCLKVLNKISTMIPVFLPSNTYKFFWDLIQLTDIIACFYIVPIVFVFKMKFTDFLPTILSWICPFLLILDIPINMNTGFYEKGALIRQRKRILIQYLKMNYIKDILSIVPLIIHFLLYEWNNQKQPYTYQNSIENYKLSEFFLLLIFFKMQHLSQIIRRIEERYHLTPRTNNIISLIKLLFTVLFVAHLFSQLWLFTAFIESSKTQYKSWIQYYNLQDSSWISQYIRAYYFATVTMITVGYGDTLPTNDPEMILCIFTMLIACGVFAYSVNSIGMILMDFSSREKEIKDNLCTINNYMDQKNVNQDLQYKIRQYLEYYWREMKDSNIEKEEKIICQLSELLRDELLLEANKLILKESPIFSSNFTDYMIMRTVKLIHEYRCAPKEIICFEDMQDDSSIYFIQKGEIDIYIDALQTSENSQNLQQTSSSTKSRILKSLKKGDHFGGVSFFTGIPRSYSICSKEFTTLLMIKRLHYYTFQLNLIKFIYFIFQFYINKDKISLIFQQKNLHKITKCFVLLGIIFYFTKTIHN